MRNKFKIIILLFISFSFISNVDAGVCNGLKNQEYCDSSLGNIIFSGMRYKLMDKEYKNEYNSGYYAGYFMDWEYDAKINGENYSSFCLDPGIHVPDNDVYTKIRELDLNISYDVELYKMYQKFINEINYVDFRYNKIYFEYAMRLLTLKNGYGNFTLKNDPITFISCAKEIDSSINITHSGTDFSSNGVCFLNNSHKDMINKYFSTRTENYLWKNPFENNNIKQEIIEPTTDNPNYTFNFYIKDLNEFFEYNNAINKDDGYTNLKLKEAEIIGYISINGTECSNISSCDVYDVTPKSYIKKVNLSSDTFTVVLTPEQYNNYFSSGGTITLNYSYNHPMNYENIFIARYKTTNPTLQRMVVVKDFIHEDSSTINVGEVKNSCQHTIDGYINESGNKVGTLSEFLDNCDCDDVNISLLNSEELTLFNNPLVCGTSSGTPKKEEKYEGGIKACNGINDSNVEYKATLSDNYEDYELKYTKVESLNDYCTETCVETININNLKGKYSTKAGMYFEFNEYPELKANKKCDVDIDYNKWLNDYQLNLQKLVEAYNAWKGAELAESSYSVSPVNDCNPIQVPCGEIMCTVYQSKYYNHSVYYEKLKASGVKVTNDGGIQYYSNKCCGESCSFNSSMYQSNFQSLLTNREAIVQLKTDLKTCNKRLFEGKNSTSKGFYSFNQKLNYYYEQTYSKNNEIIRNDKRASFGGLDDSEFKINNNWQDPINDNNNKNDGLNKQYYSFNESGVFPDEIFTFNSDPTRTVEYKVDYISPKVNKGIKNYTAKVEDITGLSNEIIKKNYIDLGYKYDTDVSAVAKNNNKNYYSFSALGDDNGTGALFNYFKNTDGNNSDNFITRECVYEITNELIDTSMINDSKLNISYRMVDAANIDPNNRLISGEGFKNWLTDEAKAVKNKIEADAIGNNTYNPDNLEYSFELDSTTLQKIREMNKERDNYSDFIDYECDNGNKCKSKFVSEYAIKDNNKLKGIGRDSWKKYSKNSSNGKCYIDNEEVKCS